jgi:hypothetical protein
MLVSAARLRELLEYTPETGIFAWRVQRSRVRAGGVAGSPCADGYVGIKIDGVLYWAHRLAWLYVTGSWPVGQIDHINRVKHDNRWCNLRDVSAKENMANRSRRDWSKPRALPPGIVKVGAKFRVRIVRNGKARRLGSFTSVQEAEAAYWQAAKTMTVASCSPS